MENFEFYNPVRVIFGSGTYKKIGINLEKSNAHRILLVHTDSNYLKESGVLDSVKLSIKNVGLELFELSGIVANPHFDKVEEGIKLSKIKKIDFIIALGGGSVIDTAKGISAGARYSGNVWNDLYEGDEELFEAIPLGVISTIPASGSEVSNPSVLTNTLINHKRTLASPLLYPKFSIIDPELYYTLPTKQIAYGIADTTTHILERYFTQTKHTELIDGLCESTLKTIMQIAPKVMQDKTNYEAWGQIGLGAIISHNDILGIGRQQNWDSHEIEHEISGIYDIPHGAGMSVIMPAWMEYVYKSNLDMFVQFAVNAMNVTLDSRSQNEIALAGINKLRSFYINTLNIPKNLRGLGVTSKNNFEKMAKGAVRFNTGNETLGQFHPEHWQDVKKIYEIAY